MLLSIIVPFYNVEKYIAKCIDSLLFQGLSAEDYEILVVNDGSTDHGADIVARYSEAHENIRLLNEEHAGVSAARNAGIEEARGEYLYFIDADDWLVEGGLKQLFDSCLSEQNRPDMLGFSHRIVDKYYGVEWEQIRPYKLSFAGTFFDYGQKYGINAYMWTWVISRKLIVDHNIRFRPYMIAEDYLFMVSVFAVTEARVVKTTLNIYRYRIHTGSTMNRFDAEYTKKIVTTLFETFRETRAAEAVSLYKKESFEEYVGYFRRKAFFSILSTSLSWKDVKLLLNRAFYENFYPIENPDTRIQKFMNFMCRRPWAIFLFSPFYRYIFLPWIKPHINRNGD